MPQATTPPVAAVIERPVIFSSDMVLTILGGRKSVMRQPARLTEGGHIREPKNASGWRRRWHPDDPEAVFGCPLGAVGDRLWVRESFSIFDKTYDSYAGAWEVGYPIKGPVSGLEPERCAVFYRAGEADDNGPWRPGSHMPRWASRILLEITSVRLERLHALTEEEARLEGVQPGETTDGDASYALGFVDAWDAQHGYKYGFGWDANPLVWRVKFKRVNP